MREQLNTLNKSFSFYFSDHRVDVEPSVDGVLYNAHIYRVMGGNDYPLDFAYVETITSIAIEEAGEKARQYILNKLTV